MKNPNYRGASATFWRSLAGARDESTFEVLRTTFCGKGEPAQVIRVGHASPACRFADVDVVTNTADLRNVDRDNFVPLRRNTTLLIAFRIEQGVLGAGLRLIKHVVNDHGRTAAASDFTLTATGPTPISGAGDVSSGPGFLAGTYTLSESGPTGYMPSAWTCTGGSQSGNQVTLAPTESAVCDITNDDVALNFVRLQSDPGDFVGAGRNYEYTQASAILTVTASGGHLTVRIQGDENWTGEFQVPNTLSRLEPGTYTGLKRYPFHDPAVGDLLTDFVPRMQFLDLLTYLPDDILAKVDRMSMAVSLESRVPFLDKAMVELAFQVPDQLKVRGGVSKWILKRIAERYIPREAVYRPKEGFSVPLKHWIAGAYRGLMEELLSEQLLQMVGLPPAPAADGRRPRAKRADRGPQLRHALARRGDRLHDRRPPVGGAERLQRQSRRHRLREPVGPVAVGLVHHEDVGDFHDAGFERLDVIAGTGDDGHDGDVRRPNDVHLVLSHADRFDQHDIESGGIEHERGLSRRARQSAQMPARRHAANEHAGVFRMRLHADAVAENRATGVRTGRIDADDAHRLTRASDLLGEPIDEGALPCTGRACDADEICATGTPVDAPNELRTRRGFVLDERDRARHGTHVACEHSLREGGLRRRTGEISISLQGAGGR